MDYPKCDYPKCYYRRVLGLTIAAIWAGWPEIGGWSGAPLSSVPSKTETKSKFVSRSTCRGAAQPEVVRAVLLLRSRISPQFEVIRAILLEDSPCCVVGEGVPHRGELQRGHPVAA